MANVFGQLRQKMRKKKNKKKSKKKIKFETNNNINIPTNIPTFCFIAFDLFNFFWRLETKLFKNKTKKKIFNRMIKEKRKRFGLYNTKIV